jgi:hypothetical protein
MNGINVFQQGLQQMTQQIPFNQLIQQPTSTLPNLTGAQFSANMRDFAQLVVVQAINEIQGKMTQSWPRTFFFNVMAANGFANAQFQAFVQQLSQFVETLCLASQKTPQTVIPEATDAFTTYSVAQMALNNQALMHALVQQNQQQAQALQMVVQDFQNSWQNLNSQMRGGGQQQQRVGMGQVGMGVQQPNAFGVGGSSTGLFTSSGAPLQTSGGFGGVDIGTATGGVNTAVFGAVQAVATPTVTAFTTGGQPGTMVASMTTAGTSGQVATPDAITTAVVNTEPAQVRQVGDAESVEWMPSAKYPALPTYDPNKEELKFHVYTDGTIQPLIAQKAIMDRNAHLAPLSITPRWATISHQLAKEHPANAGAPGADKVLAPQDLQELTYPEAPRAVATHKENWLYAEAFMLSVRNKYPDKAVLALKYAILTDTLIASAKVETLLLNLQSSANAAQAVEYLKAAFRAAALEQNHLDLRAINRIAQRLTERVNRFVTVDMSMNFGRIDSYAEDAAALAGFLKGKLGQSASDTYEQAHKRLISEALNVADDAMAEAIEQVEFNHCKLPENGELSYIHLYNNVVYGVGDLSTTELRAEIPKGGYSALVSESSTPLLYDLTQRLFNKKSAEAKGGPGFECQRFLLRTNDGVALEFSRAAFAGNSYVVALYTGD